MSDRRDERVRRRRHIEELFTKDAKGGERTVKTENEEKQIERA